VVGVQVRVVDKDDTDVPVGAVGEILVQGPQVMSGYWSLPAASEQALAGGWLHTGDAGYFDADGYLYVSDRVKDMIVSGAENVYPKEVEDVLYGLDGVADPAAVIDWCRGRLAGYKCPKSVEFLDELPRNASGKVLKRVLREPYWQGQTRQIG
jgi:fatty-acyl-CoA synthase